MIIADISQGNAYPTNYKLYQYDYGRILRIQGVNLPAAVEIDFSLSEKGGASIKRIGTTVDGVTDVPIPDSMLENNDTADHYYLYAFIYLDDGTSGQTVRKITLKVTARPKPGGIEEDPEREETTFNQIMSAVSRIADGKADTLDYKDNILRLLSGEKELSRVTIAGGSGGTAREIELQKSETAIQWRYVGETEWKDLVQLKDISGSNGKSAYQYAVEGGYTGTEEEFSEKMAAEIPSNTSDLTNDSGFVELDDSLTDNTKAAPAGMVGELKGDLAEKVPKTDYAPELKTDIMTQPVGKDSNGKLWAVPGSGGSGIAVTGATVGQTIKIAAVDDDGVPTAWESVDFPSGGTGGGHWETIYEYVSDNIIVTDFSITYDEENKYSILTVPDGVLSEFNVGDNVILSIFPLDGTSAHSPSYITGGQYDIRKTDAVILSAVEIRIQHNNDRSDLTPSNAVIEIMHGDTPKIFGDTIAFNPTSKIRYTGINTGGDISDYTNSLFYGLKYMGNRSVGYHAMKTKHMNLIANLEVANGLLLFHHTLSVNMLSGLSAFHNKWTDMDVVGYIDAPTSYMTDGKLTSMLLGNLSGTPIFPRKGGFIRIEGWYE